MTGQIWDLSATAGSNGTIEGVNVADGCPAGNLNDGIRGLAAAVRNTFTSALQSFFAGSSTLPIANGGTAGATIVDARTNLGAAAAGTNSDITALTALASPITLAQGGTGATSAAAARSALGIVNVAASSLIENGGYRTWSDGIKESWGYIDVSADSSGSVTFPSAYTSWVNVALGPQTRIGVGEAQNTGLSGNPTVTGFAVYNAQDSSMRVWWQARGV
jgi:hypothetical protein